MRLDRDDPFSNMCDDILTYEKIGKVLVVGHFNTRVVTYQNAAIDDSVMVSYFTRDSKLKLDNNVMVSIFRFDM